VPEPVPALEPEPEPTPPLKAKGKKAKPEAPDPEAAAVDDEPGGLGPTPPLKKPPEFERKAPDPDQLPGSLPEPFDGAP
jgi:hypothetical protein